MNFAEMLNYLDLSNFKPFESTGRLRLAPITLVFGPNSSGKSSLIQSLLLLKQSVGSNADSELIVRGPDVELGSYRALIHGQKIRNHLSIGFAFSDNRLHSADKSMFNLVRNTLHASFEYDWVSRSNNGQALLSSLQLHGQWSPDSFVEVSFERLGKLQFDAKQMDFEYFKLTNSSVESLSNAISQMPIRSRRNLAESMTKEIIETCKKMMIPSVISRVLNELTFGVKKSFPDTRFGSADTSSFSTLEREAFPHVRQSVVQNLNKILAIFDLGTKQSLYSITHLGPLRQQASRFTLREPAELLTVGRSGEKTLAILDHARDLIAKLNYWLNTFEMPYRLRLNRLGNVVTGEMISMALVDRAREISVAQSDVGFGVGQVLPVIVQSLIPGQQTICVEQPEIHLHPKLQAHLADLFIVTSNVAKRAVVAGPKSRKRCTSRSSEAMDS